MVWRSFVAVGDSFTEGIDDRHPETGVFRGWADLVAERLAADTASAAVTAASADAASADAASADAPSADAVRDDAVGGGAGRGGGFGYANLAIRGRLFDNIVDQQVGPALRMHPDLISFAAGGNDALRRGFEPDRLIARFDHVIGALRASGADVLVFRFADVTRRLPGQRMILPRVTQLNRSVGEVADRRGARLVDLWADEEFHNPALWSGDRLHLNAIGHQRVAAHVLIALGVEPDAALLAVPPYPPRLSWAAARAADARWTRDHLAPWVKRRLTGRSSGDLVSAKRPTLDPVRRDGSIVDERGRVELDREGIGEDRP